jgi:hypothetical protein
VYVIKITTKTLHPTVVTGAVYRNEEDAKAEVERLNNSSSWTRASYSARVLG